VGHCQNIMDELKNGEYVLCGQECNPAEQLCHDCKNGYWGSIFNSGAMR